MAGFSLHRIAALAAGVAVAMAYLQVSEVPAAPEMSTPTLDQVVDYVQADLTWFRHEVPRNLGYWQDVATHSTRDTGALIDALSGDGVRAGQ
ncbi:MAG: hypothetical protein JWR90_2639 [Marmoricola sp.]|jgi:hypothetical protein|nr:hypothetical protein [Marmoricola sp.]